MSQSQSQFSYISKAEIERDYVSEYLIQPQENLYKKLNNDNTEKDNVVKKDKDKDNVKVKVRENNENHDNEDEENQLLQFDKGEQVKDEDIIPIKIIIAYSLPAFAKMSCLVLLNIHAMLYYESIGASLIYMSFFVTLARALEIILKPAIAHFSDELKSSIGRRKPFMLIGCGFYALFLVLLFNPPSMKTSASGISIWFGVFYVLFFLAETITNVPYLALAPELSTSSKQRERLYFFFYVFQYIGVLFASAAPVALNNMFFNCDCSLCLNNPLITNVKKCLSQCNIICEVKSNEKALFYLSLFIGVYFVCSIVYLSFVIEEKSESFNPEPKEFIPSLYQLWNNKPFLTLITPWVIDVAIMTIYSSMLPFFLNFIISPHKYCYYNDIPLDRIDCSVNYWLGVTISTFFVCCIGFCFIWHLLVDKFGKRRCWQYYSLISIVPFSMFLFCGIGSNFMLLVASLLTAFPAGGAYLNDVLVSDTIDYDEFYSGKRSEGIFTVCTAFIPKFVSLFAQAIPLTIMAIIGFVPSEYGVIHTQPVQVKNFIKLFFSIVPVSLSIISFLFKLLYPIKNDKVIDRIHQGIVLQKENIESLKARVNYYKVRDPVYDRSHINVIVSTPEHSSTKNLADHFSSVKTLNKIYEDNLISIKRDIQFIILSAGLFLALGIGTLIGTFHLLSHLKYSLIPMTSLFVISISIVIIIIFSFKYNKINQAIEGKIQIDNKMLRLIMYQIMTNERHSQPKKKKMI